MANMLLNKSVRNKLESAFLYTTVLSFYFSFQACMYLPFVTTSVNRCILTAKSIFYQLTVFIIFKMIFIMNLIAYV